MHPLRLRPILKRIRWGGTRLGTVLGKPIGDASDVAESWEVCDHGSDQSVVVSGPRQGWTLSRLVRECGAELLGQHAGCTQFPLLVKFLDAQDRLSVQVHPNDDQARQHDRAENGKTEAWVILAAEPGSRIYAGLNPGVDRAALECALRDGTVEPCLHHFEVAAGDCVFIPAGTVHAIGEGVLLAEVQQSSDTTYRLYDWGRLGSDGKPRALHIEQALDCIDFTRGPVGKIAPTVIHNGAIRVEQMIHCPYFEISRFTVPQPFTLRNDNRCHILTVVRGKGELFADGTTERLAIGDTLLIPAAGLPAQIVPEPDLTLLETCLPLTRHA